MLNAITPANKELQDVDTALRRAAANVKKQAESQGTPYVVTRDVKTGRFLNKKNQTDAKAK